MVHLRSENVPNDATNFCAIFCRFLLFMQFWETMIETANSSLLKECIFKEQPRNFSFKIWWFQLFAVSFLPEYAAICGITGEELKENFKPELEKMAEVNGWTLQETHDKLSRTHAFYWQNRPHC